MQVPGFRQAKFLLFPLLHLLFPATRFCTAQRDRLGSSVFLILLETPLREESGIVTGERDGSRAGSALDAVTFTAAASSGGGHSADRGGGYGAAASSGSRLMRVLGGGHSADRNGASCAAASSGLGLLRVLGGGHSADHGGAAGAGMVACRSGLEHVTRQACSSICGLVRASGSLSSHHVDHMCSRSDGGEGDTNSCCDTHGARANACNTLHDARGNSGEHVNSGGCTYNSCGGVRGGTKPRSTSTRDQVRCPAVEKLASLQQAPGRLHVETWAGRNKNSNLPISQVVEIMSGCADMVACLPPPFFSSVSPGPGREVRNGIGWSLLEKTTRSGVWLFRGALRGNSAFFAFTAFAGWVRKGSFLTAWAVLPLSSCSCSYLYGRGTAIGPQSGERCWPLLDRLWRAIAPLMKPWCAEGDVPTAANLNLYRGRSSHVGWHSDDEPLFGERGESKLIVSVSFGTQALFKWKGKSCPSNDGHSCWLGHGDILVMDGQCQDEFRHCTDPGSDQERINITFRWVKQHVASCSFLRTGVTCCLPTCARGFSFSDTGIVGIGSFWAFWLLLGTLCILGGTSFISLPPCVYKVWVSKMCPLLDTPCGRRSVGALSLLPLGSLLGSTKNYQLCKMWDLVFFWFLSCIC